MLCVSCDVRVCRTWSWSLSPWSVRNTTCVPLCPVCMCLVCAEKTWRKLRIVWSGSPITCSHVCRIQSSVPVCTGTCTGTFVEREHHGDVLNGHTCGNGASSDQLQHFAYQITVRPRKCLYHVQTRKIECESCKLIGKTVPFSSFEE